jgi:hypothetical protein
MRGFRSRDIKLPPFSCTLSRFDAIDVTASIRQGRRQNFDQEESSSCRSAANSVESQIFETTIDCGMHELMRSGPPSDPRAP